MIRTAISASRASIVSKDESVMALGPQNKSASRPASKRGGGVLPTYLGYHVFQGAVAIAGLVKPVHLDVGHDALLGAPLVGIHPDEDGDAQVAQRQLDAARRHGPAGKRRRGRQAHAGPLQRGLWQAKPDPEALHGRELQERRALGGRGGLLAGRVDAREVGPYGVEDGWQRELSAAAGALGAAEACKRREDGLAQEAVVHCVGGEGVRRRRWPEGLGHADGDGYRDGLGAVLSSPGVAGALDGGLDVLDADCGGRFARGEEQRVRGSDGY